MTPAVLQAMRRWLFFSVEEAARWIAARDKSPCGVSPRSWQYWERGERSIPDEVSETINGLCAWRASAYAAAAEQLNMMGENAETVVLVWYQSVDDWTSLPGRNAILWRPQCSVIAEIAATHKTEIVQFDFVDYVKWLGNRPDSEILRAQWAASK